MITATQVIIHSFFPCCPFLFAVSVLSEEFAVALHEVRIKAFSLVFGGYVSAEQVSLPPQGALFDAPRP